MKQNWKLATYLILCASSAHSAIAQTVGSPSGSSPNPAPTQDSPSAPTASGTAGGAAASTADGHSVAEIIVTAQRRSENLQNVPIAITALPAARLQSANISSTASLQNITPAITFSNVLGFVEPRIRGIGSSSAGAGVENSVATYVDGVYISSAPGSLLDLNNAARVEVLKGPQGTLFGRNATGGLIQVITKDPKSTFGGNADLSYANYNTVAGDLYVTGPIATGVAADFSLTGNHQGDGYGHDLVTGKDINKTDRNIGARSKWLLDLGPDTKVRLSFDISNTVGSYPELQAVNGTASPYYRSGAPTFAPIIIHEKPFDSLSNDTASHKILTGGVSVHVDQQIGDVALSSITAYRRVDFQQEFDADGTPLQIAQEFFKQDDKQFSQELQLSSRQGGRFQWIAGVYYFNLDSKFDPLQLAILSPPNQSSTYLNDNLTTRSVAGYVQASYEIFDRTTLTGGFRYTYERRTIDGTSTAVAASGASAVATVIPAHLTTDTPTWRISLDHKFGSTVLGYLSYNRGFKSGGFNSQGPTLSTSAANIPAYKPEYIDAYEAGMKTVLFDHRLRFNAAAFYYNYRDVQVNTYIGSFGLIYNGARAKVYGLDVDFDLALTDALTFNGGVTLLHDRFTNFPLAQISTVQPNGTIGIAPGSATGNRLPFAPDATYSIGLDYKRQLGSTSADLAINDLYSTGYYGQADNKLKQSSYHQVNASVTIRPDGSRFSLKLFASNILNEYIANYLSSSTLGDSVSFQPPRTYGASIGVKF